MTIKQIILLILATVIVSQTNAMDRIPRQSHSSSNQGHPHSFFNQGQVVNFGKLTHNGPIFNSGSLINYGNMIINYPVPPVYSHQPQYFMQPGNYAAYQAKQRMEKQAEECEKQKAQQKCYNELQELNEVRDFLPEKQAQQIDRILSKLSSKEGHAIAEIVIPQLNKIPEVQDVKPFIHILRDTKQPIITKQSQSTSENKSILKLSINSSASEAAIQATHLK